MDGILVIDKPEGLTSHDVVARVRRIFGTRRVGHTGTLDPFATGVLVVLVGNATRLARFLDKDVKEYVAEVQFGAETDTGDKTGTLRTEPRSSAEIAKALRSIDWKSLLGEFRGELLQTPPMYSAKKVDGRRLYEMAREGKEVERQPVPVTIYELEMIDESNIGDGRVVLRVACSAGTYIRTLAEDIGRRVGLGAHLVTLRRTAAGKFDLQQSFTLEQLKGPSPHLMLLPSDFAISHLPEFVLPLDRLEPTRSGLATTAHDTRYQSGDFVRMTHEGHVIAVGIVDAEQKYVKPKIVLV